MCQLHQPPQGLEKKSKGRPSPEDYTRGVSSKAVAELSALPGSPPRLPEGKGWLSVHFSEAFELLFLSPSCFQGQCSHSY